MAREEIIEKLDRFLLKHAPLTEECHVVYLMVEIRKILDHERNHWNPRMYGDPLTLLRFYCDWTLHTEKTKITDNMKAIMSEVFNDIKAQIENPAMRQSMSPVMQFAYMDKLKDGLKQFFEQRNITPILVGDGWLPFIQLLVKVLQNQPIKNPIDDVLLFSFLPAADRCVRGIINFTQPIKGYNHYTFGNAY